MKPKSVLCKLGFHDPIIDEMEYGIMKEMARQEMEQQGHIRRFLLTPPSRCSRCGVYTQGKV